jgi:hypothetical protein
MWTFLVGIRTLVAWNPRPVWKVILRWSRRRVCRQGSWRAAWHWLRDCSCLGPHPAAPRGRLFADIPESLSPVTYTPELTQTAMWRKFDINLARFGVLKALFLGILVFWYMIMCYWVSGPRRFGGFLWSMKIKAPRFFQTPGKPRPNTQRHIPEDLNSHFTPWKPFSSRGLRDTSVTYFNSRCLYMDC